MRVGGSGHNGMEDNASSRAHAIAIEFDVVLITIYVRIARYYMHSNEIDTSIHRKSFSLA